MPKVLMQNTGTELKQIFQETHMIQMCFLKDLELMRSNMSHLYNWIQHWYWQNHLCCFLFPNLQLKVVVRMFWSGDPFDAWMSRFLHKPCHYINKQLWVYSRPFSNYILLIKSHYPTENTVNVFTNSWFIQLVHNSPNFVLIHLKILIIAFYRFLISSRICNYTSILSHWCHHCFQHISYFNFINFPSFSHHW